MKLRMTVTTIKVFLNMVDFPPPTKFILTVVAPRLGWANKTKEITCTLSEVQG